MLRRNAPRFYAATALCLGGGASTPAPSIRVMRDVAPPSPTHERSGFNYAPSTKEVGARNEAAFIDYHTVTPKATEQKYAVPHLVNLLTVLPVYMLIFVANAVGWGIVAWYLYATTKYNTVIIERPQSA